MYFKALNQDGRKYCLIDTPGFEHRKITKMFRSYI